NKMILIARFMIPRFHSKTAERTAFHLTPASGRPTTRKARFVMRRSKPAQESTVNVNDKREARSKQLASLALHKRVPAIYQFRESTAAGAVMRSDSSLKRPQEINDVLLLLSSQPVETFDDLICLAAIAQVVSDGFHQVGRPSIMEERRYVVRHPKEERFGTRRGRHHLV